VLGADGSLSIEPIEQVSKVVGVIESKVNLRYVVHQRWPGVTVSITAHMSRPGTFSITYRTSELSLENRVMASARLVRLTPESRHS